MLGLYENFPPNIHLVKVFTFSLSKKYLQQQFTHFFRDVNRKNLSFEEVGNPTVPGGTVIFEVGIADDQSFSFIDKEEAQKMLTTIDHEPLPVIDLFCIIRYYKNIKPKKMPLKFDYYMTRIAFGKDHTVELQVFHERGPRYVCPEDLIAFIVRKVNAMTPRKILNPFEST